MNKLLLYCFLLCIPFTGMGQEKCQEINPVLLDQSFIDKYGTSPGESTSEDLRIHTHLIYVEQLLRRASVEALNASQRAGRSTILDLLHQYATAGKFPVNADYPGERRPCFIDDQGTICAVGYLIEQTKGRELAEEINSKHQYDFLLAMNEPVIELWADEFGLTLEECAMIQPAYGSLPGSETRVANLPAGYGIASGVLGAGNALINIAYQSGRWKHDPALPYIGLITGTSQLIMGVANIKRARSDYWFNGGEVTTSYKKQNTVSYINIALGTTTIITSALNLAMNKKMRDKRNAFNLYSNPDYTNTLSMGLSFTRRI